MTVGEAKDLLRRRYQQRGFTVKSIRYSNEAFTVAFGEDETGAGKGPQGLSSIRCNWPDKDPGAQMGLLFGPKKPRRRS